MGRVTIKETWSKFIYPGLSPASNRRVTIRETWKRFEWYEKFCLYYMMAAIVILSAALVFYIMEIGR